MKIEINPIKIFNWLKTLVIGGARNPFDAGIFQKISLIAFFAWVGLGADSLSSCCYGPAEAFISLKNHPYLSIFVALATAFTIFVISASYSQIIELFPSGGGGYLVASKLLSPTFGMISGCALLIDYVLTIAISIASGADALFSFLPPEWIQYKLAFAAIGVLILILLNLRGVKESVSILAPVFLIFVLTHLFLILYAVITHLLDLPKVAANVTYDVTSAYSEIGIIGMFVLILRAYSMGAGTYTGIEAVSNAMSILREPRVETGKRTMKYMAISLSVAVIGLMFAYFLYEVVPCEGKTLNAVVLEAMTANWGENISRIFISVTLISEAAILFVAAQTGFLGGPRVLANMALDKWFPTRFALLSDRLMTKNGIFMMGISALILLFFTRGSVQLLVVLYSISVFITFILSQLGMVRHWWITRVKVEQWKKKLFINGIGLVLTIFILISMIIAKFQEGGWITLFITVLLILAVVVIKNHYKRVAKMLERLDSLVQVSKTPEGGIPGRQIEAAVPECEPKAKTAILLVNGYNGLGLHTLFSVIRLFGNTFKNFVFLQVGVIDAGVFKGAAELQRLQIKVKKEVDAYVNFMRSHGYPSEGYLAIGTDVVEETVKMAPQIVERFPQAIFFGGQLIFQEYSILSAWLDNYLVFAMQRRFYYQGVPFVILPVRVI
ncbi:MAG: APC family permease [Candidatus Aureabacteria bacterium]|nr:APC family permease [Candidatus Auribacterota bacterium]